VATEHSEDTISRHRGRRWLSAIERYGALLAAALTVFAILVRYLGKGVLLNQYDDAYITLRYAENLSRGNGLVFNAGELTDSASSISYTLLLALFHFVGLRNLPLVTTVIGIAAAAGIATVVYSTCLKRTWRPVLSLILAVSAGTHGLISGWAVTGMETVPFAFLIALAVQRLFFVRACGWFEVGLIGVILWTRLEGIVLGVAWGALWLSRLVRARADAHARSTLFKQATCLVAVGLLFVLFKLWLYGAFVPHAFQLKQITTLYAPNPASLWDFWSRYALPLVVLAAIGLTTLPRRYETLVLLAYVAVSAVSVVRGPYADWARYSAHLLPICVMLAAVPVSVLWSTLKAAGALGCALVVSDSYISMNALLDANAIAAGHQVCRLNVGRFLEKRPRKSDAAVLSSDIGAIAYAAPSVRFIDAVGLTSADILEAHARGVSADPTLFAKRPTVIADTCAGTCTRPSDFSAENWFIGEGYWRTPLGAHTYTQHLQNGTVLFRCRSPDGLSFGASENAPRACWSVAHRLERGLPSRSVSGGSSRRAQLARRRSPYPHARR